MYLLREQKSCSAAKDKCELEFFVSGQTLTHERSASAMQRK